MGWAYGEVNGRPVGYAVIARCDEPDCKEIIDRGLSYVCGSDIGGGDHGCGLHFCDRHLELTRFANEERSVELCSKCIAELHACGYYQYDEENDEWYIND